MIEKNKKITERERRIYELKKKTQELEKYKFVLDFKIKELNLLIFSYVFKTAHNLLILKTDHFTG